MWINLTGATPDAAMLAATRRANEARVATLFARYAATRRAVTALAAPLRRATARRRRARLVAQEMAALRSIDARLYADLALYPQNFRDTAESAAASEPGANDPAPRRAA